MLTKLILIVYVIHMKYLSYTLLFHKIRQIVRVTMPARGRPKRTTRTSRGQTSESSNNPGMKIRVRNSPSFEYFH